MIILHTQASNPSPDQARFRILASLWSLTTMPLSANKPLNANAAEFVPGSFAESWVSCEEGSEDHITPEELAELEAAEGWVDMLAELEDLEDEHLIAVALRYAPLDKVAEIQKRCGLKPHKLRMHKGIRTRHAAKGF